MSASLPLLGAAALPVSTEQLALIAALGQGVGDASASRPATTLAVHWRDATSR